jgi:hypothetical protein
LKWFTNLNIPIGTVKLNKNCIIRIIGQLKLEIRQIIGNSIVRLIGSKKRSMGAFSMVQFWKRYSAVFLYSKKSTSVENE